MFEDTTVCMQRSFMLYLFCKILLTRNKLSLMFLTVLWLFYLTYTHINLHTLYIHILPFLGQWSIRRPSLSLFISKWLIFPVFVLFVLLEVEEEGNKSWASSKALARCKLISLGSSALASCCRFLFVSPKM